MIDLSLVGGCVGDGRVATGVGDQSIERRGIVLDHQRIGKARITASYRSDDLAGHP
jgi:hypothetical protein